MSPSILLFLSELGTCPKNIIFKRNVEGCQKNHILLRGMLKFTNKGRLLTIKIAYEKFLDWKSEQWKHALLHSLYIDIFIFENYQNLNFWWNFKVSSLGRFWQFWAVLSRICCIHTGWELARSLAEIFKTL